LAWEIEFVSDSSERFFLDVVSGRRRGAGSTALRLALAVASPPYAAATRLRNLLYDRGVLPSRSLPRPAVSVGNITVGGTGKTPLVCWLASALRAAGRKPAVLLRGYKTADEEILIAQASPDTPVVADPDRRHGAQAALAKQADVDLFILDDAMQHRRVRRNFEIVLINAAQPWGYGSVLPRGLLREPIGGLCRADAVVFTHASEASLDQLVDVEATLRKHNRDAPIFLADHELTGIMAPKEELPMSALSDRPYFVAAGIGQPDSFLAALQAHGKKCVGHRVFADHHRFSNEDVASLRRQAAGAAAIVVTEKDWTKLRNLSVIQDDGIPFWRAQLRIHFRNDGDKRLLDLVCRRTAK
jgi:tetraacyldisaccharide 4'-kinase